MPCFCETPSINAEVYQDGWVFGGTSQCRGNITSLCTQMQTGKCCKYRRNTCSRGKTLIIFQYLCRWAWCYLVWSLLPQSRCTPGSGTQACCRSCRSHICTVRWDSPPGFHSCRRHELAAVDADNREVTGVSAEPRLRPAAGSIDMTPSWQLLTLLTGNFIQLATALYHICQHGMRIPLQSWQSLRQRRKVQSAETFRTHTTKPIFFWQRSKKPEEKENRYKRGDLGRAAASLCSGKCSPASTAQRTTVKHKALSAISQVKKRERKKRQKRQQQKKRWKGPKLKKKVIELGASKWERGGTVRVVLNTADWQKQSSSVVWCLHLHCHRCPPVSPHRFALMTSNLTQRLWNWAPSHTGTRQRDSHPPWEHHSTGGGLLLSVTSRWGEEKSAALFADSHDGLWGDHCGWGAPVRQFHSFWNFHEY